MLHNRATDENVKRINRQISAVRRARVFWKMRRMTMFDFFSRRPAPPTPAADDKRAEREAAERAERERAERERIRALVREEIDAAFAEPLDDAAIKSSDLETKE